MAFPKTQTKVPETNNHTVKAPDNTTAKYTRKKQHKIEQLNLEFSM